MSAAVREKAVVTREMVFAECERLKEAGIEPTNRKLLETLGGSMTTIAGYLREWRALQSISAPVAVAAVEVPANVTDAGTQAAFAIWQVCHAEAQRKIEVVTEEANQRVQAADAERDKVLGELGDSVDDLTSARTKLGELETESTSLRQAVALALSTEAALKATIEQMTKQIEAQAAELERVHAEQERARKAHSTDIDRMAADFGRQMTAQADALTTAHAEVSAIRAKLESKDAELHAALERGAAVKLDLAKAQGEIATITAERDQLQKTLAAAAENHATVKGELATLRAEFDSTRNQVAAMAQERDGARADLAGVRDQLTATTAQRDTVTSERDALRAQVTSQLEVIGRFSDRKGKQA